jgi:hypothetical protein
MRESWTDERLDDLNAKVDRGFEQTGVEIRELRREFVALRTVSSDEFKALRGEMKQGFDGVEARFDAMYRLMIQLGGTVIAALLGLLVTQMRLAPAGPGTVQGRC